ncbi:MAG: hypothetical protein QME28_02850 [Candidatus Saccharicenans sp.]|nr:hypothetical protein [Candidatus Saccharicenans sp.]
MKKTGFLLLLVSLLNLALANSVLAQAGPGQYTEEAPLGSWNTPGPQTAPALGSGFSELTRGHASSVVYTNPALLGLLPSVSLSLTGSYNQIQLFRYWLVNTGVIYTSGNLTWRGFQFEHFGASCRSGNWTLAVGMALIENYGRPGVDYRQLSSGIIYHRLTISQSGIQTGYSIGLARSFREKLYLGISFIYYRGSTARHLEEIWPQSEIQLSDWRDQKISGFYPVFGAFYKIGSLYFLGFSLTPPHRKKVTGESLLTYTTPATEIRINGEARDVIKQPFRVGFGGKVLVNREIQLSLEAMYSDWKHYSFYYFGEEQNRNFRSTVRLSAGFEYNGKFRLFGRSWLAPYFAGLAVDPQPDAEVRSTYYYLTFGSGAGNESFRLTFSTALAFESGSGNHLKRNKISLTLDLYPDRFKKSSRENNR